MPKPKSHPHKNSVSPTKERWASDLIVDLLHAYELPHAALNPGASYRGLHDSIVNYGGNRPTMMLCQHEETAVQIAHGYAKASGQPMVAILHNLVGLLHANMAIYYAYIDRAPIFIVGATGPWTRPSGARASTGSIPRRTGRGGAQLHQVGLPAAYDRRRARGLRARVRGDDDRAQGPIYMCYDAWLQEQKLDTKCPSRRLTRRRCRAGSRRSRRRLPRPRILSPQRKGP